MDHVLETALTRLGHSLEARLAFERVISIAEQAGDTQRTGLAALKLVEELGRDLTNDELCLVVDRAKSFLSESRDIATVRRLAIDACNVLSDVFGGIPFSTLRSPDRNFNDMVYSPVVGSKKQVLSAKTR